MATDPNQSPTGGLRQNVRRAQIFEDTNPIVLSDDYAAANLAATRGAATWGDPIDMRGRDEITIFMDITKVSGQLTVVCAFQYGLSDSKSDVEWYDSYAGFTQEQGDSITIPTTVRDLSLNVGAFANSTHKLAISLKVRSPWMRFKPFGSGTVTGSRCTLRGIRHVRSS